MVNHSIRDSPCTSSTQAEHIQNPEFSILGLISWGLNSEFVKPVFFFFFSFSVFLCACIRHAVTVSSAHQSVMRVNPAVGGTLGGAVGRVPAPEHAAVVTLLGHTATTAAPGIAAVVAV